MMKTSLSVVNAIRSITAASLLLLLVVDIPEANAVVVKGLYDVEYPVPDQSRTVRTAVFNKGLEEVLIRVSGDRSVLKNLVPGSQPVTLLHAVISTESSNLKNSFKYP